MNARVLSELGRRTDEPPVSWLMATALTEYGLPVEIHGDFHGFFFTDNPKALTHLGQALHFYGVTLRHTPAPKAKSKVGRPHFFCQQRLPAYTEYCVAFCP